VEGLVVPWSPVTIHAHDVHVHAPRGKFGVLLVCCGDFKSHQRRHIVTAEYLFETIFVK
jgi:sortase (surface protein transpeptidase)